MASNHDETHFGYDKMQVPSAIGNTKPIIIKQFIVIWISSYYCGYKSMLTHNTVVVLDVPPYSIAAL